MSSSIIELILVLLTGIGHVSVEVYTCGLTGVADSLNKPQHYYNLMAAVLWSGYLLYRVIRSPSLVREWGFKRNGFGGAMKAGAAFSIVAAIPLFAFGAWKGTLPLPSTFWLVALLYPLWGLAQQFALQALLTRNLRQIVPKIPFRAVAAAVIFSAAHFPNYELMALTLAAGIGFTWIYEKFGNLWAVGIAHGFLGALAYYLVLGQDPGAEIAGIFR